MGSGSEDAAGPQQAIPTQAAPAGFDETSGAIEGVVLDDEANPVPGAQVGLLELDLATLTDVEGRFTFSNVPAGRYSVFAQKLGYNSAVSAIQVNVGQVQSVQLELETIVIHTAFIDSWKTVGYFECSWTGFGGTGPCFFPWFTIDWPLNNRKWNYLAHEGAMSIFNEMTWSAGTAATGTQMSIQFSYADRTPGHTWCSLAGVSPLIVRWDRDTEDLEDWQCTNGGQGGQPDAEPQFIPMEGMNLQTFVNTGPQTLVPVGGPGIAYQQEFDIYFSIAYWDPASPDYSALPDS